MKYKVYTYYRKAVNVASFESFTDAFIYLMVMRMYYCGAYITYNRRIVFRLDEYISAHYAQDLREREGYLCEVLRKPVSFVSDYLNRLKIKEGMLSL